jgi:DNA-binding MarR family transcriptional regulator
MGDDDRRTVLVSLTARGLRAAGRVLHARRNVLQDLVGQLSVSERSALHAISTNSKARCLLRRTGTVFLRASKKFVRGMQCVFECQMAESA